MINYMNVTKCGSGEIYSIPMSGIEYIGYFYGNNGSELVTSAYTRLTKLRGRAPDLLFNVELFEFDTRKPVSDVVCGGTIHKLGENYGIAFPNNNTAVFSYKNNVGAKDYVGAYPVLIRGGKIETSEPQGLTGSRGRTAIGVGNGNFYAALIPDGSNDVTLSTLRNHMKSAGATDAINLDGGGSTQFYAPNGNFFTTRPVRGFIGIWLKDSENKITEKHKVFLSAGHGGTDPGAVAYSLKEKEINLQTLLACKSELERHGVDVICSRVTDEDDKTVDEVKEANASGAELAVSFHANAGKGDGFEVYYWSTNVEDKRLAELCEKYVKTLGQNSRGLKTGDHLYWCKNTTMTSCLVESFFVDNDIDNDIGDTIEEQKAFGVAYANAILEYLGIERIEPEKKTEENVLYKVQVGAFSVKANADALAEKLKALGYPTYVVKGEK